MTEKKNREREREREREKEAQRRVESVAIIPKCKEREIKKNESEKEIGSNGEMETREERESYVADGERERCVGRREKNK